MFKLFFIFFWLLYSSSFFSPVIPAFLLGLLQADSSEYYDSHWGSCHPAIWGLSPVATGKVRLQQMRDNFGALFSEFIL